MDGLTRINLSLKYSSLQVYANVKETNNYNILLYV